MSFEDAPSRDAFWALRVLRGSSVYTVRRMVPIMDIPAVNDSSALEHDETRSDLAAPVVATSRPSASKDWRQWPKNHPSYFPLFDDIPHRRIFCDCGRPDCRWCDQTREVFHISEYTASGREVMDEKVNTLQLKTYLEESDKLGRERPSSEAAERPSFRLFFLCNDHIAHSMSCGYMQRFLAYFQTPPHFVLRKNPDEVVPPFQISTAVCTSSPGAAEKHGDLPPGQIASKPGMLYILIQLSPYVPAEEDQSYPEYYSSQFGANFRRWSQRAASTYRGTTLYLCYSYNTRQCSILIAESSPTFHHLRRFCAAPHGVVGSDDPFVFVVAFVEQMLEHTRNVYHFNRELLWQRERDFRSMSTLTDNTQVFKDINNTSVVIPIQQGVVLTIERTVTRIKHEHKRFLDTLSTKVAQGAAQIMVDERLDAQLQLASELHHSWDALTTAYQRLTDMYLGYAQIQNGLATNKIAADNQKQASATEALARDSRRDSEIMKRDSATMKTITVVTLVYLPATFVSTLLSMGMFDFGVETGGDGRVQIARQGWIFLAISLPLTALTLGLAYLWKRAKERQFGREAEDERKDAEGETLRAAQENLPENSASAAAADETPAPASSEVEAERKDAETGGTLPAGPAPQENEPLAETSAPPAAADGTPEPASMKARISGFLHLRRRRAPPTDSEAAETSK